MVRDFSPQLGRASAMGFWTVGPVAGSLITSIVANRTLSHFVDWQSQFIISGLTALATFLVCLFFMKDLSSKLRDQLMVTVRDRTLLEARARGLSETEVAAALEHPWRQIAKWDLVGSSVGIAVFLLIYYAAAGFFTIYYSVTFLNTNGTNFTTSQVNGLNTWFWGANIIALIVVGIVSDLLKVRKPLMLVGAVGSIVTLIVFLSYATHPHTTQTTLALTSAVLAVFLSLTYAPWMASYTETVEAKNPALVGTGLALWGWILRLTVGISFIFLPIVINSVSPVVNNEPYAAAICYPQPTATTCITSTKAAKQHVTGQSIADFVATQPESVAFAQAHAALLTKIQPYTATLAAAAKGTLAAVARASKALGPATLAQVLQVREDTDRPRPAVHRPVELPVGPPGPTDRSPGRGDEGADPVAALVLDRPRRDGHLHPDDLADPRPVEPAAGPPGRAGARAGRGGRARPAAPVRRRRRGFLSDGGASRCG